MITLLLSALLAIGTGVGFIAVGTITLRKQRAGADAAQTMLSIFWFSAATIWITQGLGSLAGFLGMANLPIENALDEVGAPAYCLAAASLLYYALYLNTGKRTLLAPILVYYIALDLALRYLVGAARRLDIKVQAWQVSFVYETPLQSTAYTIVVALIALPLIASVFAYLSLAFRVRNPPVQYRIVLVSTGLLAWVLTEALAATTGITNTDAGEITRRLVALASTFVILLAYYPPAWAQRLWRARAWSSTAPPE